MEMQDVCAAMLEEIDGALGCIVIDMQTGLTVAAEYRSGSVVDTAVVNLVSVISTDMFRGKMISQFESVLTRPKSGLPGFVREVQMTTAAINQFMAAIPGWDDGILVLVTDKNVSLGLGWMAVHRMIGRMEAAESAWPAPHQPHRHSAQAHSPDPNSPDATAARRIEPSVRFPAKQTIADGHDGLASDPADKPKPQVALGPRMSFASRKSRGANKK